MLNVFMIALGLGFFWWRWLMRMPANATSEENENGIRLCSRRRSCRGLTVLLALRTAAA
jgi:hypothetical protein